jgi:hypothetical protein
MSSNGESVVFLKGQLIRKVEAVVFQVDVGQLGGERAVESRKQ